MFVYTLLNLWVLSLCCRYTLDNLKFGKMDITRYPDVAKKYVHRFLLWKHFFRVMKVRMAYFILFIKHTFSF